MASWTLYYNPKCMTCRKTLSLLEKKGVKPEIREYLKNPPSAAEVKKLIGMVEGGAEALVRKKDGAFKKLKLEGKTLSDAQWAKTLSENPSLIERPVVIRGSRAVVARPPEKASALF